MVLLGFFPLWVVLVFSFSADWWCCIPSPPLGGGAFPVLLGLLFFWWFFAVFPSSFGGVAFLRLLWVERRSPSLLLGDAAWSPPSLGGVAFLLSFCVVLPSFRP